MPKQFMTSLCVIMLMLSCRPGYEIVGLKQKSETVLDPISDKMRAYVDQGVVPGMSLLAVRNDKEIYNQRFGFSNISQRDTLSDESIYRIFSMSKPITAVALMTLYDQGKFSLDDKLSMYIPDFGQTPVYREDMDQGNTESQQNEITIRHLLTHSSGIGYGWGDSYVARLYRDSMFIDDPLDIESVVGRLSRIPLKNQPGTVWEYGHSLDVVGYLIEVLSGLPLDEYMRHTIFDPLDMNHTGFSVPQEKQSQLVEIYTIDEKNSLIQHSMSENEEIKNEVTLFMGGAGLVSTVSDYRNFCSMLLNGGIWQGRRILEKSTTDLILTNQLPTLVQYEEGKGHGLGGAIDLNTGEYYWGGSASTKFWINPNSGLMILAFSQMMPANSDFADDFKQMIDQTINR